jgi:hypothetical protein
MTHPDFLLVLARIEDVGRELALATDMRSRVVDKLLAGRDGDPVLEWSAGALLATAVEVIYTGMEETLRQLLKVTDKLLPTRDGSFHAALLAQARAAVDGPEGRPPILSLKTYELLNQLRAFRHFERNNYRFRFDFTLTETNFRRAAEVVPIFRAEVEAIIRYYSDTSDTD